MLTCECCREPVTEDAAKWTDDGFPLCPTCWHELVPEDAEAEA